MTDAPAYHTHPDYLALLAAIRSNPADDLPRLIAADWLDEHGHGERADLVRRSIRHHGWQFDRRTKEWKEYKRLMQAVFGSLSVGLVSVWHQDYTIRLRRGFVTAVHSCSFAEWAAHAARILPESVGLAVRLTDRPVVEWSLVNRFVGVRGTTAEFTSVQIARLRGEGGAAGEWVEVGAGVMDTAETLLRRLWPDVARWEVPEYTPAEEVIAADLRRSFHPDLWPALGVGPMSRGPMVDQV